MPKTDRKSKTTMRGGWFRMYRDVLNDPKIQRLSPHLRATWLNLLCVAAGDPADQGHLPSDDDLAFALRMSIHDVRSHLDDLIIAGLIDILPDGTRQPHNWCERQPRGDRSAAFRMQKLRARKRMRDVTLDGDVTQGVTSRVTESSCSSSCSDSFPPRTNIHPRKSERVVVGHYTHETGGDA